MGTHLSIAKAEERLLGFVGELLSTWPRWIEVTAASMREAVNEAARRLPESLRADEARLRSKSTTLST